MSYFRQDNTHHSEHTVHMALLVPTLGPNLANSGLAMHVLSSALQLH